MQQIDNIIEVIKSPAETADSSLPLGLMREALREDTLIKRKENRTSAWNKNRTNLGECSNNEFFSIKYVDEKAKLLRKKRLPLDVYRYLPNALIQCEENINSFLRVDQSLSGLIRDLSGNIPILQLYAANCCCNIALGNRKACTALGKAIVPYLIIELESLNYALLDVCVRTIGNLCAGSSTAFSILHAQHCLKYLILLLDNCDELILPSVIYAVLHYVHIGFHEISKYEMARLVQVTMKWNLLYKDPNFTWLLALFSSSTICTTYLHPIIPQVVHYLYQTDITANMSQITASIRILANTLYNSCEDKVNIFLRSQNHSQEHLCYLLNMLLMDGYIHVRKEALWLIGNLYNHESSNIRQNIKDIIPFLSLNEAVSSIGNCESKHKQCLF